MRDRRGLYDDSDTSSDDDSDLQASPIAMFTKRPVFCWLIVLANTVMFVVSIGYNGWQFEPISENPLLGPSPQTLDSLGAKNTEKMLNGEWWRFLAPCWLHGGVIHLLLNMVAVWRLGVGLERAFGPVRVATVYLASGVSGVVLSAIFLPQVLSVGASGALYGLLGALFGDFAQNYRYIPQEHRRGYLMSLVISSVIGLGIGLFPLLDNFNHVGGFVCGILLGAALFRLRVPHEEDEVTIQDIEIDSQHFVGDVRVEESSRSGSRKCVTLSLMLLAAWATALAVSLFSNMNAHEWCTWCRHISCVNTPWWECPDYFGPMCTVYQQRQGYVRYWTGPCCQVNGVSAVCPGDKCKVVDETPGGTRTERGTESCPDVSGSVNSSPDSNRSDEPFYPLNDTCRRTDPILRSDV